MKAPRKELQPMAKAINAAMKARGLNVAMLTEALGLDKTQRGAVANWVAGKNGPGDAVRPRLAQVLGMAEGELTSPIGSRKYPSRGRPMLGPAQRAVALVEVARSNGELIPAPPPVTDVWSLRARSDGSMVVKMDAHLPAGPGIQFAQFLLAFRMTPENEP